MIEWLNLLGPTDPKLSSSLKGAGCFSSQDTEQNSYTHITTWVHDDPCDLKHTDLNYVSEMSSKQC